MLRLAVVSLLVAAALATTPIFQGKHYTAYKLHDADLKAQPVRAYGEYTEVVNGVGRTIIENPSDYDVPDDTGGNWGDMEFDTRDKTGTLVNRDTIVNQYNEVDLHIFYNRSFPGLFIEDLRVFNVGRERGYVQSGMIAHAAGFVDAHIYVAKGNTVRLFVEVYTAPNPDDP